MPMSPAFVQRLNSNLLMQTVEEFRTPFQLYDWQGIEDGALEIARLFSEVPGNPRNLYAVKALPNPEILRGLLQLGMGFDCSSGPEVGLARVVGAERCDMMFTSNNTTPKEFELALDANGILNIDDIALIDKIPKGGFRKPFLSASIQGTAELQAIKSSGIPVNLSMVCPTNISSRHSPRRKHAERSALASTPCSSVTSSIIDS